MNYQIGDKVLCINDKNWKVSLTNYPECGEVYTIRGIIEYDTQVIGFLLDEIHNPIPEGKKYETTFLSHRFTKLTLDELEEEELTEEILVKQIERMLDNGDTRKLEELLERI